MKVLCVHITGAIARLLRYTTLAIAGLLIGAGSVSNLAWAQQHVAAYRSVPPSIDGIGKQYLGREIAQVMGWQGAAWLEREEREREERTDLLLAALALKPGMTVGDIGAGTGYLSRRMARRVAPNGRVFAVDVQPQMIELLKRTATEARLDNVVPTLGTPVDIKLPEASLDLAIMVDVYHELAFPREMLENIVRALRVGGQLVFVEYRAEDPAVPIKPLHKMSEAQVRLEAGQQAALKWERTVETLPWQHVVVFQKRAAGD